MISMFCSTYLVPPIDQDTNQSASVNNLGVVLDSSLNFRKHISQTCRACFYHIRDLRRIKKVILRMFLDLAKQIAVALVSGKLDYCNSFFTICQKRISLDYNAFRPALQACQPTGPRFSRPVPIPKRLHWLPVKFRIYFKICAINSQTLNDNHPAYLADLLVRPKCSKCLRSTNSNIFILPRIKTNTGSRAFSIPGPTLWNAQPVPISNAGTILPFRK